MTRRTSADFAHDAKSDDPWEYQIKGRKTPCRPKAISHFTFDERNELRLAQLKYSKTIQDGDVEALLKYPRDEQPMFVSLRVRFGKDFEAFWAEACQWPEDKITTLITELDEHYDPPTADDKNAAADPESEAGKARLTSVGS